MDPLVFNTAGIGVGAAATAASIIMSLDQATRRRVARLVPCSGYSVRGRRHIWNEDHYTCLYDYDEEKGRQIVTAAIADGVSQGRAGALAAKLAAETVAWMLHSAATMLPEEYPEDSARDRIKNELGSGVLRVDGLLKQTYSQFTSPTFFAATTLTAVIAIPRRYYCMVHVGNTRLYEVRADELKQRTRDQETQTGQLSSALATLPHIRPVPEADCIRLKKKVSHLLLVSDGLSRILDDKRHRAEIARLIRRSYTPPLAAKEVIRYAREAAGGSLGDDATAVVVLAE